ncbi:MAG: MCE family protein [Cyanobacteria bacterium SIG26]|nr:MCE family protein [Cyanobacteria bacterium SIG26]
MKFSSSFKVGLLTLVALVMLVGAVLKVKGRAFSSAKRIEIQFKDVNGLRPGAGVQIMGLKVGQVEEITPIVKGENSFVNVKFVVTDPTVQIPRASSFSIQQSGLIGELFLEITPPKIRTIYIPMQDRNLLYKNDAVQMKLSDKMYDVGLIKSVDVISRNSLPFNYKNNITTPYAYKVDYFINLPGLVLPEFVKGKIVKEDKTHKLNISPLDEMPIEYPDQKTPYTIIEPMRLSDFMDWQYKAAETLTETNQKVNEILTDETIANLKRTIASVEELTAKSNVTLGKVDELLDSSKDDIEQLLAMTQQATNDFSKLSHNINEIIGDKEFKTTLLSTADSVDKLSKNLNKVMDAADAEQTGKNLKIIAENLSQISDSVNSMTKDDKLKNQLTSAITNVNCAMSEVATALDTVNKVNPSNPNQASDLQQIVSDTVVTTNNLKKFSEKLNKRFLLFRLLF